MLIAMSVCMFLLLAVIGLAFDLGRVYIARNEAQIFTDAASMAAAQQLDGTAAGLDRARSRGAAPAQPLEPGNRRRFNGVIVEFSADGEHWETRAEERGRCPLCARDRSRQSCGDHVPARRGRPGKFHRSGARRRGYESR